jgi:hypothetical protein
MGIAKKKFGLKTCQPIYMEEAVVLSDKELRAAVEDIVVREARSFNTFNGGLCLYPLSLGVLYSAVETTSYAFVAYSPILGFGLYFETQPSMWYGL